MYQGGDGRGKVGDLSMDGMIRNRSSRRSRLGSGLSRLWVSQVDYSVSPGRMSLLQRILSPGLVDLVLDLVDLGCAKSTTLFVIVD